VIPPASDLDSSLRAVGSRLFVVRGDPVEELPRLLTEWKVDRLTFESDTEPYARRSVTRCRVARPRRCTAATNLANLAKSGCISRHAWCVPAVLDSLNPSSSRVQA
jgi:deoxyribodipyrimidine photolyase